MGFGGRVDPWRQQWRPWRRYTYSHKLRADAKPAPKHLGAPTAGAVGGDGGEDTAIANHPNHPHPPSTERKEGAKKRNQPEPSQMSKVKSSETGQSQPGVSGLKS